MNISKNITVSCCKIEGFRYSTHVSYCTGYYPTRSTVGYFFEKIMNPGMMNLVIPDSRSGDRRGEGGQVPLITVVHTRYTDRVLR